jgi:hypothetical protein
MRLAEEGTVLIYVGLNERGNNTYNGGFSGSPGTAPNNRCLNMGQMIVREHKESWISGKSEVTIKAITQRNGQYYNGISYHALLGWNESTIYNVKRKTIKNQIPLNVNQTIAIPDRDPSLYIGPYDNNFALHYVIFEKIRGLLETALEHLSFRV